MPAAYLVSDIHIMSPDSDRGRLFEGFLRTLNRREASHLILLGDIFDLWVADHRYFIDNYAAIIAEIVRLKREGVEIHYFEGNHDLHLEYYWARELGLRVHAGPAHLKLAGHAVRLEHGDQMDPDDRGYLFLRWFLRTPPVRFLIRHLPGRIIAAIGDRASATSREYTSQRKTISADAAVEKIRRHALKAWQEEAFDLIVSGHVHIRDDWHAEQGFRSINLGSWLDRPCYLRIDTGGAAFHELGAGREPNSAADVSEGELPAAGTAAS